MNTRSFILGALSGLSVTTAGAAAIYIYLKRTRKQPANIKGYLDLIPDLTPEQRAWVEEIRQVFLPKVDALRTNMRLRRAELAELLFDEAADRAKLDSIAEQIIQQQAELERAVIEHILEEKGLLTAAQQRRFHNIIVAQFSSGGVGVHDLHRPRPEGGR